MSYLKFSFQYSVMFSQIIVCIILVFQTACSICLFVIFRHEYRLIVSLLLCWSVNKTNQI